MKTLSKALDGLHTIETEINYYRQQANYFEKYAAQLMEMDVKQFQKETELYKGIMSNIENAKTENTLNMVLKQALKDINCTIPWKTLGNFNDFMHDKSAYLSFE